MGTAFDDGHEFNQLFRALESSMAQFRFMERSTEAYEKALNDLEETFNAFHDLLDDRYRKIETDEEEAAAKEFRERA